MKKYQLSKTKKYVLIMLVIGLIVLQMLNVFFKKKDQEVINDVTDLNGCEIGLLLGASYNTSIQKMFPDSKFSFYSTYSDMIQDLKAGRIDSYIADKPIAMTHVRQSGELRILDTFLTKDEYGFILEKNNTKLCEELNQAIRELKKEGELNRLIEKWIEVGEEHYLELNESASAPNGVLKIATNADSAPFSYNYSGDIIGYDIEVLGLAAEKLGYQIQTTQYAFGSLLNSVISGREDIAVGGITYTDERSKEVLFTDSVYEGGTVAVLAGESSFTNPLQSMKNAINKMLLMEERWKQIVAGIGVTIFISIVTLVCGTLLGILLSILMRHENQKISKLFTCISTVLDTLPLLIILMILYYVIFAKYRISAMVIAIIGLTLVFANTVAGLLNTGLLAIDRGQLEAAEAMGYRKEQIFMKIAFPQIMKQMYSQYVGAVTSMVKDTSIVGYITVQDLTNVSDTIRSTTYQAFFPLLLSAVIYFLIAKIIVKILTRLMEHFQVSRSPKGDRGVE